MTAPGILVVTGASGAGKTAAVRALAARELTGVACFYFDSIGVPDPATMAERFGSSDGWQEAATRDWVSRLHVAPVEVAVLDGQTRPSFVLAALREVQHPRAQVVLLDCAAPERARRLAGPRGQPELATPRMDTWAAYLRGQADALALPVLDTTRATVDVVAAQLALEVARLRDIAPSAAQSLLAADEAAGR